MLFRSLTKLGLLAFSLYMGGRRDVGESGRQALAWEEGGSQDW